MPSMQCLICKSRMDRFLEKNGYELYKCPECQFIRTDLKREYQSFVKSFYTKAYFTGDPKRTAFEDYKNDKPLIIRNMGTFLSHIEKILPKGKLLDVGCAMGFFVELADEHGYDAYGCDPSSFAIEQGHPRIRKKLKVSTVESAKYPPRSFDVITLFDVFEHLSDPERDLQKLRTLLKPEGLIVIATGDTASVSARTMRRRWTFYNPPQHLSYFNKDNLTTLLVRTGFEPVSWFRIGKWLSLGYVLHLARTLAESRLADMLYQRLKRMDSVASFPLYLPMQDNMVVIAHIHGKTTRHS